MPIGRNEDGGRRIRIHWAWVPAGIFAVVVGWMRYGWITTVLAVVGGLVVAAYAEWRARRRRRMSGLS